jgi:hypothetical protein
MNGRFFDIVERRRRMLGKDKFLQIGTQVIGSFGSITAAMNSASVELVARLCFGAIGNSTIIQDSRVGVLTETRLVSFSRNIALE